MHYKVLTPQKRDLLFMYIVSFRKWHFCFATHRRAFMHAVLLSWNYKAIVSPASWKHNKFQNYWRVRLKLIKNCDTCMYETFTQSQLLGSLKQSSKKHWCFFRSLSERPQKLRLTFTDVLGIANRCKSTKDNFFFLNRSPEKLKIWKRLGVKQRNNLQ